MKSNRLFSLPVLSELHCPQGQKCLTILVFYHHKHLFPALASEGPLDVADVNDVPQL